MKMRKLKNRWNWEQIKLKFLESDHREVKNFFLHFYGTFNSTIKHKTIGWSKAKKIHLKRAQFKAIESLEIKMSISLEEAYSKLMLWIFDVIEQNSVNPTLSIYELCILWKIVRTELGLPISYNSSQVRSYQIDWDKESEAFESLRNNVLDRIR